MKKTNKQPSLTPKAAKKDFFKMLVKGKNHKYPSRNK